MSKTSSRVKRSVLVFDFDGVVCDSTNECLVTSWNAWQSYFNKTGFRSKITEFSDDEISQFKPLRYYVRGAGEYYILRRILEEKRTSEVNNFKDFNSIGREWGKEVASFKKHMFSSREILRNHSLDDWIKLHHIYAEVIKVIKESLMEENIYIATLKDLSSVRLILKKEEIDFPEEKIFHQGLINTKLEALQHILNMENVNSHDILFFDDVVNHLIEPSRNGYQAYQTSWGNVPKDYIIEATKKKIPLADLNTLASLCSTN